VAGRLLVPRRLASRGEVVLTLTAILVQLEDHDIRALILGMGRVVAVSRRIPVLAEATTDLHDLNGRPGWLRFSIRTTAWESRLMKDAVTIVVVHTSRQHGQSLLNVEAGANFLQRVNGPGHFVGPDPPVQRKPIKPGHLPAHAGERVQGNRIMRGSTSVFDLWLNDIRPVHWGDPILRPIGYSPVASTGRVEPKKW
jgi:hypothetical protein